MDPNASIIIENIMTSTLCETRFCMQCLLFLGKTLSELAKAGSETRKVKENSGYVDQYPLVWFDFEKHGYVTLFAENNPEQGKQRHPSKNIIFLKKISTKMKFSRSVANIVFNSFSSNGLLLHVIVSELYFDILNLFFFSRDVQFSPERF